MSYKDPHKGGRFVGVPNSDMVTWVADKPEEEAKKYLAAFSLNRWTDVSVALGMIEKPEWLFLLQRATWEWVTVFTLRLSIWRVELEIEFDYVEGGRS